MEVFRQVVAELNNAKLPSLQIRGILLESKSEDTYYCRIEATCSNEQGIGSLMTLMKSLQTGCKLGKVIFTYVRIMGNDGSAANDLTVTQVGFEQLMQGFEQGLFSMANTFRLYNFKPEVTPFLVFVDSLKNNPTLQTIGFARNQLTEDICAGVLQRIYFNQVIRTVDLNSNNVASTKFRSDYIKPYFSSKPDLNIIVD